jgi:hypothetical protein
MEKRIQNLEDAIADLKADKESKMGDDKEEEMSSETQPLKSRTVKEEFSEEVKKEELTEAAVKPIKHNPESVSKKTNKVQFAKGKFNTTLDRVLNKLNK